LGVSAKDSILLLDLDGVVVFESGAPLCQALEILALHDGLWEHVSNIGLRTFILTHRSRAEARRILAAADVPQNAVAGVLAAEDLFQSGLRHGSWLDLATGGLRKSLILPEIERRTGAHRSRMALIDDRIDNVEDMVAAGVGLVLHAPSAIGADGRSIETFDFAEAAEAVRRWAAGEPVEKVVRLTSRTLAVEHFRRTGHNTRFEARHAFNVVRMIAGRSRRYLSRSRGRWGAG
jgi:hypothetical protein